MIKLSKLPLGHSGRGFRGGRAMTIVYFYQVKTADHEVFSKVTMLK